MDSRVETDCLNSKFNVCHNYFQKTVNTIKREALL